MFPHLPFQTGSRNFLTWGTVEADEGVKREVGVVVKNRRDW